MIKTGRTAVVASARRPEAPKQEDGRAWKIFTVVLPIILTTIFGFWIWQVEKNIETKISESNEKLKTELTLREEFYKKKLATYEKTHEQMAQLAEALQNAQVDPESKGRAIQSLHDMYQDYSIHNLYMSNEVVKELETLCDLGEDLPYLRKSGTSDMSQIAAQIANVENMMRKDLHVDEIGSVSDVLQRSGT